MEIKRTLKQIMLINNTGKYYITYEDFTNIHKYLYNANIDKGFELQTVVKNRRADYIIIYDILLFKTSIIEFLLKYI